ncbi:MAG: endonuclease NucS domain-containing protein [Desulfococcaceae bacterium]|nr:endonuclease NucS domain-containing protein [Desulfococcaceae bacterium]
MIPYEEYQFKDSNLESELESLLESNPDYFFEDSKILIIGRQVTTNLNTFIDLLGIDKNGNTVAVELKREKTPRETIAQLLEYASFVENLDYAQLNEIYQNYTGEDVDLESFHKEYFNAESDEALSFNKNLF